MNVTWSKSHMCMNCELRCPGNLRRVSDYNKMVQLKKKKNSLTVNAGFKERMLLGLCRATDECNMVQITHVHAVWTLVSRRACFWDCAELLMNITGSISNTCMNCELWLQGKYASGIVQSFWWI
jgi:hypothetical protein